MSDDRKDQETEELDILADQASRMAAEGAVVAVDPDVAEHMGAFEDDAMDAIDAAESRFDDEIVDEIVADDEIVNKITDDGDLEENQAATFTADQVNDNRKGA